MIQRVLMAVINADHPQRGMEHAFRGFFGAAHVASYDYLDRKRRGLSNEDINREFLATAQAFQPDWIWGQFQMTEVITGPTILDVRKALPKCVVSHWMGDMRRSIAPSLADISKACHLTLISNEGQYDLFHLAGAKEVAYCQIAVDWEEDVLGLPSWMPPFVVPKVVFCGSNYGNAFPGTKDREAAAKALMEAGVDFGIVGGGWNAKEFPVVGKCEVKQQHHIYQRCQVALNVNNFNDVPRYYSDRLLIAMASGKPVVAHQVPDLDNDFTDDRHLMLYKTGEELVEKVRFLLNYEKTRTDIGTWGRTEVVRSHTWFSRITHLLPMIERIRRGL